MKSKWFHSLDHALNSQNLGLKKKNGKQPCKKLTSGELKLFAEQRGMTVSTKTVETAKKAIDVSALPESLKKFVK